MPWKNRRRFLKQAAALAGGSLFVEPLIAAGPSPQPFFARQAARREELWTLLGDLPPRDRAVTARLLRSEEHDSYVLEHLELDLNGLETAPALLLLPKLRPSKAPGLLYIHAHGGTYEVGKEELLVGRNVLPTYAPVLAERGIVTLAIDSWCFSGRKHVEDGRQGESDTFKEMLWRGRVLWGMMMYDEVQALSYLAGRSEVDASRLGAFGLSMGSTKAWWLAALDPRVKLCVDLCCLTDYGTPSARAWNLLFRATAAQAFSSAGHQRADRATRASEPQWPPGCAHAADRGGAHRGALASAIRRTWPSRGLSHRAVRLRTRGNAGNAAARARVVRSPPGGRQLSSPTCKR